MFKFKLVGLLMLACCISGCASRSKSLSLRDDSFVKPGSAKGADNSLAARIRSRFQRNAGVPTEAPPTIDGFSDSQLTNRQLAEVQQFLATSDLSSKVTFSSTAGTGAVVWCRLITDETRGRPVGRTGETVLLPIGIYCIWTVRDGHPTSSEEAVSFIVHKEQTVILQERAIQ